MKRKWYHIFDENFSEVISEMKTETLTVTKVMILTEDDLRAESKASEHTCNKR
jgi:hypothetical protein